MRCSLSKDALARPSSPHALRLAVDHFPRYQLIFKMRIAIDKAAPLLFPLFQRRLSILSRFEELSQRVYHE